MAVIGHFEIWMLQAYKNPQISITFLRVTVAKKKGIPI
jgi:hypothetical protein